MAESAISVHPFSSRWRDATLAHLPRAKGHRRSWNRAFEKLCVCVSRPSRLPSWKLIASRGTRNRIFEMLIFLVELSMGRLLLFLEARGKEVFLFFFRIEKLDLREIKQFCCNIFFGICLRSIFLNTWKDRYLDGTRRKVWMV